MAHNERLVDAPPEAVFDVLADPRGYAYWVVGSIEIRDADPDWPQVGSRFHHTVGMGPLRLKDHTVVEDVELGRFLQLKTQARPLGNARVKLELERLDGATKVTMTEDAADKPTAFVFLPLTHLLVHGRNRRSLDRLAELAEGRRPIPGDEADAPSRDPREGGSVENPEARARREPGGSGTPAVVVRGALAGLAGALLMSVSTNAEMRLRGRPPSSAPARAIARLFGLRIRDKQRKKVLGTAGHFSTALLLGAARGLLDRAGLSSTKAGSLLLVMTMTPEVVVVPALGAADPPWKWSAADAAVSIFHHSVFAAATNAAYELLER